MPNKDLDITETVWGRIYNSTHSEAVDVGVSSTLGPLYPRLAQDNMLNVFP
jgi:hypothetical protein